MLDEILVFIEWMARHEETNGVFFARQALHGQPGFSISQDKVAGRIGTEQVVLTSVVVDCSSPQDPVGVLEQLTAIAIEFVERACRNQSFKSALVNAAGVDAMSEVRKRLERPVFTPFLYEPLGGGAAHILQRTQSVSNGL